MKDVARESPLGAISHGIVWWRVAGAVGADGPWDADIPFSHKVLFQNRRMSLMTGLRISGDGRERIGQCHGLLSDRDKARIGRRGRAERELSRCKDCLVHVVNVVEVPVASP